MQKRSFPVWLGVSTFVMSLTLLASFFVFIPQRAQASASARAATTPFQGKLTLGGTTQITTTAQGSGRYQTPEIDSIITGLTSGAFGESQSLRDRITNRSLSHFASKSVSGADNVLEPSHKQLVKGFDGITERQQRLANNGNQFTLEPPDQGLCAGNGFVMESVNDALAVYSTDGKTLKGVTDLNTFYGYAPAIVRGTPAVYGPEPTDPGCYFDKPTQRWFQIVLTLEHVGTTAPLSGVNHIDIAVSQTASPLGKWNIYRLPTQDDGTQGTPNHKCDGGACLGDYPHLGADSKGFYITTNEYPFFGSGFHAAQIYAFPKLLLAAGTSNLFYGQIDTIGLINGNPGFTVWPAISPEDKYSHEQQGTEYFLSSNAAQEANGSGASRDLLVWSLSHTDSLTKASTDLNLSYTTNQINAYSIPPQALQKAGQHPLGECLNVPACANQVLLKPDIYQEVEGTLDTSDTRMQQVTYVNGRLWGALGTTLTVDGVNQAGIEWFVVKPTTKITGVTAKVINNGYVGAHNASVIYPALGITSSGKGAMGFTLSGPNNYPSAAYVLIDEYGTSKIQMAAAGKGPQDGFSEYKAFSTNPNGTPRPRWGDYGAAVPVGNSIWLASEYIGQSCTLKQYQTDTPDSPLFSCNKTRVALGNWYTRITEVGITR